MKEYNVYIDESGDEGIKLLKSVLTKKGLLDENEEIFKLSEKIGRLKLIAKDK